MSNNPITEIIEDFPFTTILGAVGLLVGLMLPSGLDYFSSMQWFNATDPAGTITGAVIGMPIAFMTEVICGLIGALIMGIVGLIIDGFRGAFSRGRNY
jgi:hypothetical protein